MNWWDFNSVEEASQRTYDSLKDIAFKQRQHHATPVESND